MTHWLFKDLEGANKPLQNLAGEVIKARTEYYTRGSKAEKRTVEHWLFKEVKVKIPPWMRVLMLGVTGSIIAGLILRRI